MEVPVVLRPPGPGGGDPWGAWPSETFVCVQKSQLLLAPVRNQEEGFLPGMRLSNVGSRKVRGNDCLMCFNLWRHAGTVLIVQADRHVKPDRLTCLGLNSGDGSFASHHQWVH